MDVATHRPTAAANNHRWPAAAASELVISGDITLGNFLPICKEGRRSGEGRKKLFDMWAEMNGLGGIGRNRCHGWL
jgi:hypothetical protein